MNIYMTEKEVQRETRRLYVDFTICLVVGIYGAVMSVLTQISWFMPLACLPTGMFVGSGIAMMGYFKERLKYNADHPFLPPRGEES